MGSCQSRKASSKRKLNNWSTDDFVDISSYDYNVSATTNSSPSVNMVIEKQEVHVHNHPKSCYNYRRHNQVSASIASTSNENSGRAIVKREPKETKKNNEIFFGHFECPKCLRTWKSGNAYVDCTQQCWKCRISVSATKLHLMKHHRNELRC